MEQLRTYAGEISLSSFACFHLIQAGGKAAKRFKVRFQEIVPNWRQSCKALGVEEIG